VISIVSICISGASFLFTFTTFIMRKRDEHEAELRQFLLDSTQAADRLTAVLYVSVSKRVLPLRNEQLDEALEDLRGVAVQEERWQGETFDAAFQTMKKAVENLGKAQVEYSRSGVTIDDLKDAMEAAIPAVQAYSKLAKERLRA